MPRTAVRTAYKVRRYKIEQALHELELHHKHYKGDIINQQVLDGLPEDGVPDGLNIIEEEMQDSVLITQDVFLKWVELAKPIAYKLHQYLEAQEIPITDYFAHVSEQTRREDNSGDKDSLDNERLQQFLQDSSLLDANDSATNRDLVLGELTHTVMEMENTEDEPPVQCGNIAHGEEEAQRDACTRFFNDMTRAVHHIPCLGDSVVVTSGALRLNIGTVQSENDDGSVQVLFDHLPPGAGPPFMENLQVDCLHIQSKPGALPIPSDLVRLEHGARALFIEQKAGEYVLQTVDGQVVSAEPSTVALIEYPPSATSASGRQCTQQNRTPLPVFDPPVRDENPIPF